MRRPPALTKIIDTLETLFNDEETSRTVVGRAGIDDGMIAFDARSLVNWTNIVNEAIRQKALPALIDAAAELRPDVPELKQHLADFEKWAARYESMPDLTDTLTSQKVPGLWERARVAILAWFGIAVGCFALVGILARESTHAFLGIPGSHLGDAFTNPGAAAAEGLSFVGRTLIMAGTYAGYNPIGFIAAIALAAAFIYFTVRRPQLVDRAYIPAVIVPLLIVAAIAKGLWFDLPTVFFEDVLDRYTVDPFTLDPPTLTSRVDTIWKDVVCSRVAGLQNEETQRICGTLNERVATRRGMARHLLNVIFTIAICGLGVAVLRKLAIPSRNPRWNLPFTWKWALVGATAIAVLAALLAVPWTYGRTVASMKLPYVCQGEDCGPQLCADHCYALLDGTWKRVPEKSEGEVVATRDILTEAFREQLGMAQPVAPPPANRFP